MTIKDHVRDHLYDLFASPPAQRHSETSVAAAEAIAPDAAALREQVYQYIRSQSSHGAIDEEIQLALDMCGDTERPRPAAGRARPGPGGWRRFGWWWKRGSNEQA